MDDGQVGVDYNVVRDPLKWKARVRLEKFNGDLGPGHSRQAPYEVLEFEDNLLMYGGASCVWQSLIGNGTATANQTLTYFNNANAAVGVGDSSAAEVGTQTDLQAASNKARVAMDATYPVHTDGTTSAAASIVFRSTFASAAGNFVWAEWAIFNSATVGRMLNRKVQALGTKVAGTSWQLTITLTVS